MNRLVTFVIAIAVTLIAHSALAGWCSCSVGGHRNGYSLHSSRGWDYTWYERGYRRSCYDCHQQQQAVRTAPANWKSLAFESLDRQLQSQIKIVESQQEYQQYRSVFDALAANTSNYNAFSNRMFGIVSQGYTPYSQQGTTTFGYQGYSTPAANYTSQSQYSEHWGAPIDLMAVYAAYGNTVESMVDGAKKLGGIQGELTGKAADIAARAAEAQVNASRGEIVERSINAAANAIAASKADPAQAKTTTRSQTIQIGPNAGQQQPQATVDERKLLSAMQGVIFSRCYRCHNDVEAKGKVNLKEWWVNLDPDLWQTIQSVVVSGQMPPKDHPPLDPQVIEWFKAYQPGMGLTPVPKAKETPQ